MFQSFRNTRARAATLLGGVCVLWLLAACSIGAPAGSPTTDVRDYVAAPFQTFVAKHQDLLGVPISRPLRDAQTDRMVQYFANGRLEYDETEDAVTLTDLGVWAGEGAPTRTPSAPLGIAEAFDRYVAVQGGDALLGPALGDVMLENERWVRYHANVRLEWDPALPAGRRVQPAPLGRSHYATIGAFLAVADEDSAGLSGNAGLEAVAVEAFGTLPIVYEGDTQTLVVVVKDLTNKARDDIAVRAVLSWGAESLPVTLDRTDENGLSRRTLDLSAVPPGTWVTVTVNASFNGRPLGGTRFIFQTWW